MRVTCPVHLTFLALVTRHEYSSWSSSSRTVCTLRLVPPSLGILFSKTFSSFFPYIQSSTHCAHSFHIHPLWLLQEERNMHRAWPIPLRCLPFETAASQTVPQRNSGLISGLRHLSYKLGPPQTYPSTITTDTNNKNFDCRRIFHYSPQYLQTSALTTRLITPWPTPSLSIHLSQQFVVMKMPALNDPKLST